MITRRGVYVSLVLLLTASGSGLPQRTQDLARLDRAPDRASFREWFSFLAEVQAFTPPAPEITDCAALLRFAYREALRAHDSTWASAIRLPLVPGFADVQKYQYPHGPTGPNLFRTSAATWAEFADAQTLQRLNSFFVSRNLDFARPGDLLFYRQLSSHMPFHAMVFVGKSRLSPDRDPWIVYHTGPSRDSKGEIRRVAVRELKAHPSPQWRPVLDNPNFLGVYRWNILDTQ